MIFFYVMLFYVIFFGVLVFCQILCFCFIVWYAMFTFTNSETAKIFSVEKFNNDWHTSSCFVLFCFLNGFHSFRIIINLFISNFLLNNN